MTGIITNSLLYRYLSCISQTFLKYWVESFARKKIYTLPSYSSPQLARESIILAAVSRLFNLILRPLAAAGLYMRRVFPGSVFLNLDPPAVLSQSQTARAIAGIRVESALWLVVFYPVADFMMRKIQALAFLSGSWDELLLLFIITAWPVQMALRGNITYRYSGLDMPILVYTGITLFLFFMRSPNAGLAVEGLRVYLEYLLWFFIGSNLIINRRQFDALTKGIVLVAVLISVVGVYQYVAGVETPAHWVDQAEAGIKTRVFSIVVSPNVLGSLMVVFIPVTLGRLLASDNRRNQSLYIGALLLMLACMVFTYSRGAWLALAGAMAVLSLLYNPRLLLLMGAGSLAAAQMVPGIGSRLAYMFSSEYLASSGKAGRIALWQKGLDKFLQDPLLGSGFGTYGGAVAARRIPGSVYTDNFYLKTAVESGLIGLMALLWLLACTFRCGYAAYRKISDNSLKIMAAAILAGLIGVALHNSVENIFEVPMMATYFWFLSGVLISIPHLEDPAVSNQESGKIKSCQQN